MVKNPLAIWETCFPSLGWEDPLEKGMATHSSILAWRIPWTEEPGRLQSIGSQRVGPELVTFTFTCLHIISSSQDFLRPRCSASWLPLGSLRWGWRKHPLVLLPKELRAVPLTGLCNEGYLLQGTQKCEDWSLKVQTDGEGLPPPHDEPLGADVMGVVLCIVSRCLEVAALDPQACSGKNEILETS